MCEQARCLEAASRLDGAQHENKRMRLDHQAAVSGVQAMQARMARYQDEIEDLQSRSSHHQLQHDQKLM